MTRAHVAVEGTMMSAKNWEKRVLDEPGAAKRVEELEVELRLAADQQRGAARDEACPPTRDSHGRVSG